MKTYCKQMILYLAPWVMAAALVGLGWWWAEAAAPRLIADAYAERTWPALNRIIRDRTRPVEFYLQEWHQRRKGLFCAALAVAAVWAAGSAHLALWLRRRPAELGRLTRHQLDRAILVFVLGSAGGLFFLLVYPLLAGHVYLYDDLGYLHLPLRSYYSRALQQGRIPTWCPELLCGFDAHGEGQGGFYHPVKLALYGLLPLRMAFNVDTVLAYPAAFGGMWFFLRRWRFGHGPAALGGMTYAFSAYLALRLNHTNVIQILAHVPWLLACIDMAIRLPSRRGRWWAGAAVAALTASQLLLGYPPSVWYSGLAELAYAVAIGWGRRSYPRISSEELRSSEELPGVRRWTEQAKELAGKLLPLASAKLLGLLLAAVQVLPTLAQIPLSQRGHLDLKGVASDSLIPWNFFQWISPYAFRDWTVGPARPWEFAQYAGLLAPAALAWLFVEQRRRGRSGGLVSARHRLLVRWALVMLVLGAVFALGKYGPVFWLLAQTPPFSLFRSWARYSVWIYLAGSVAAAAAVQFLLCRAGRSRCPSDQPAALQTPGLPRPIHFGIGVLVFLAGTVILLAEWNTWIGLNIPWANFPGLLVGPLGLLVIWKLLAESGKDKPWALLTLVSVHLADLACFDLSYWLTRCRFDRMENFIASLDLPPDQKGRHLLSGSSSAEEWLPRLWTPPAQEANVFLLVGRRSAGGWWGGLIPKQSLPYPDPKALRVAGVAWWKKSPFGPEPWQAVPNPLPEVRLVPQAMVSQDPAKDLLRIDPARTVLIDRPSCPLPAGGEEQGEGNLFPLSPPREREACAAGRVRGQFPLSPPRERARVRGTPPHPASPSATPASPAWGEAEALEVLERRAGLFRIHTECPNRQWLVVAETWHPGWQALVDGRPAEILRAYGDLMAVALGPGMQEVEVRWAPASLRWGLVGSCLGLVGLLVWLALGWRSGLRFPVEPAAAPAAPAAPEPAASGPTNAAQESLAAAHQRSSR